MIAVMIIIFIVLMLIGVPMAFSAGAAALFYVVANDIPISIVAQCIFKSTDNFSMLSIPLFILAGDLMNNGGITKAIIRFARALVGHIRGSLAHITILANMMFAAMSGSASAACACMGSMMIPSMKEEKYDGGFACAVTASSSILGPIIPPSVIFVLYGSITGTSVSSLLMGGIVPGIMLGAFFMMVSSIIAKKRNYPVGEKIGWNERIKAFGGAIPALIAPLIIIGGILSGIFTATEAGAIAAVYALIVGFVSKELTVKKVFSCLINTAKVTAAILLVTGCAQALSWVLASEQIPQHMAQAIMGMSTNKTTFFIVTIIFLLIVGCFIIETASVPILAPIFCVMAAQFGIHPVQYGVIFVLLVCVGSLTPPVGSMLFVASKVGETSITEIIKNIWPFLLAIAVAVVLLVAFPGIITFLPNLVGN